MTREEAKSLLQAAKIMLMGKDNQPISDLYYALEMAIQALSQEPCEDAISRQAVLDRIRESVETYYNQYTADMLSMWGLFTRFIKEMPSIKPYEPQEGSGKE